MRRSPRERHLFVDVKAFLPCLNPKPGRVAIVFTADIRFLARTYVAAGPYLDYERLLNTLSVRFRNISPLKKTCYRQASSSMVRPDRLAPEEGAVSSVSPMLNQHFVNEGPRIHKQFWLHEPQGVLSI